MNPFGSDPDNRAAECMGDCTGTCETCALRRLRAGIDVERGRHTLDGLRRVARHVVESTAKTDLIAELCPAEFANAVEASGTAGGHPISLIVYGDGFQVEVRPKVEAEPNRLTIFAREDAPS